MYDDEDQDDELSRKSVGGPGPSEINTQPQQVSRKEEGEEDEAPEARRRRDDSPRSLFDPL